MRNSRIAEDNATNATEAVDSDLDNHCNVSVRRERERGVCWEKGLRWMEGN